MRKITIAAMTLLAGVVAVEAVLSIRLGAKDAQAASSTLWSPASSTPTDTMPPTPRPTRTPAPTETAENTPTVTPTPTSERPFATAHLDLTVNGQQGPITVVVGDTVTYRWTLSATRNSSSVAFAAGVSSSIVELDGLCPPYVLSCEQSALIAMLTPGAVTDWVHLDYLYSSPSGTFGTPSSGDDSAEVWVVTATPCPDSDGDSLDDCEEAVLGTDPHTIDSDGDGLLDGQEVSLYHTDPLVADTDDDACGDGSEVGLGLEPTNPWDFYSVPVPALFAALDPTIVFRDHEVSASDAQAVFGYFKKVAKTGSTEYGQDLNNNGVPDGIEYDRSVIIGQPGASGPPNGVVSATDAQLAFVQFKMGYHCSTPPSTVTVTPTPTPTSTITPTPT